LARGDPLTHDDPARLHDPPGWGYSLANVRELILACLDAAGVRSILEIGAFAGELTEPMLDWAATSGATIATIDPVPPDPLLELCRAHPELELLQETSHEVLGKLERLPDSIVIDGDHNYFTLTEELRLIAEKAGDERIPLLFFHDVCWPHARRDTYYSLERIPDDGRPPVGVGENVGLAPGVKGVHELGFPYPAAALEEGGPRNGTVTAIEDFLATREGLRFVIVPAFFGFGVIWDESAPWSGDVAAILDQFDRNPVLARLEANRVEHMVAGHARGVKLSRSEERRAEQELLLRKLLGSRAFAVMERISGLNQRGKGPVVSRADVRRALGD
jgi:hypothetical protein